MDKERCAILVLCVIAVSSVTLFSFSDISEHELKTISAESPPPDYSLGHLSEDMPYTVKGTVIGLHISPAYCNEIVIPCIFTDVVIDVYNDDNENQQYAKDAITVRIQSAQTEDEWMTTEFSSPFEIGEEVFLFVAAKEPDSIYDEDVFLFITSMEHDNTHNDDRYVTGLKYDKSTPDGDRYVNGDYLKDVSEEPSEERT